MKKLIYQLCFLLLFPQLALAAFPQVVSTSTGEETSDTATHVMPIAGLGAITNGNTLLCMAAVDCNSADSNCPTAAVTSGSGWSAVTNLNNGPSNFNVLTFWLTKVANGSDTVTLTLSGGTTNTQKGTSICWQLSGAGTVSGTGLASSGSGNFNAPSHTCPGGSADNLFIVFRGGDSGTASSQLPSCPTNYGNLLVEDATDTSGAHSGSCRRELTAASDDPANVVMTSEQWVAWTMCIEPAAAPTPTPTPTNTPTNTPTATPTNTPTPTATNTPVPAAAPPLLKLYQDGDY